MNSLSLKVITLLMAALVLSASGCFNDEMSSPEGTMKGYLKALDQLNYKRIQSYFDPRKVSKEDRQELYRLVRDMRRARRKEY